MSPHGMHHPRYHGARHGGTPNSCLRTECILLILPTRLHQLSSQLMSPHGMHPNTTCRYAAIRSSQLMSPHGMHHGLRLGARKGFDSQLMSPHGMHLRPQALMRGANSSQLMSPHGMHPDRHHQKHRQNHLPTHVSARNASGGHLCRSRRHRSPNSCLRTECIVDGRLCKAQQQLPTHVSARNASQGVLNTFSDEVGSQLMSPHGMHL